tara:strand:- start:555 stop:956 length:402 start_codon:yes stop_codon:yes gene_type:complete
MRRRTHNPPMFLKKLSSAHLLRQIEASTYFKDIDTTVRDIVKWEGIQSQETPEDTAQYDDGTQPAILLSVLRVVALTETMTIGGVTALVAGVLLDAKLKDAYDKLQISGAEAIDHQTKYQHVRALLDSLGPKR